MIELNHDSLRFSFPGVHPDAQLTIEVQRTLRIPDDDRDYPLPPGLGRFPLRHVDDFAARVPRTWIEHGGVMVPMYQSEAMWLRFAAGYSDEHDAAYPMAIRVATGKIDAVTGLPWEPGLRRNPQNYMVGSVQPWLDGYCVEKGIIRQFVAMPLGAGYTAEEQITGRAEHGGLQLAVFPMKREAFERRFPKGRRARQTRLAMPACAPAGDVVLDMGLAPGGRMRQEIYDDPYKLEEWDLAHSSRCFVHIANSLVWRAITGGLPPTPPPTAEEYTRAGLPWFEYYDDSASAVDGSKILKGLLSVIQMGQKKGDVPLPENQSVDPERIVEIRLGLKEGQVREGRF
jgi:hypothetical protein